MNTRFEQALAWHRGGQLDAAAQGYQSLLAQDPGHAQALIHLGAVRLAQGLAPEAEASLRLAVVAAPASAPAHGTLAAALQAQGRVGEAIECYRRALELDPALWDAHCGLATALQLERRHDEAVECLRTVLRSKPDHAEAHYSLAVLLQQLARSDEAQTHYRAALAVDADFAEASYGLGTLLLRAGQCEQAAACMRQALDVDPAYVEARHALATALRGLGRNEEAVQACEAVLAVEPNHAAALHDMAEALAQLGRYGPAEAAFLRALDLRPKFTAALAGLGRIQLEQGELRAAQHHLSAAMTLEPDNPAILFHAAQAGKVASADPVLRHAEALLLREAALPAAAREQVHFTLAKACDDIGEHERAFRHLLVGNAIRRQRVHYDEAGALGFLDLLARIFSAQRVADGRALGDPTTTPVFVVGMPRSGSTLVEQILASHPAVHGAGENLVFAAVVEQMTRRFGDPATALQAPNASDYLRAMGAAYVEAMRPLAPAATRIVDKSLGNFRFAALIHLALPNARIIHVVRDPVDTCLSCFAQMFTEGTLEFTFDLAELGRFYRAQATLMGHWRSVLPPHVMLEVSYEALVSNFEAEARRIVAHCGLEWSDTCRAFHETKRPVRTASVAQVRQPIYQTSVGRWRPGPALLRPLLDALAGP